MAKTVDAFSTIEELRLRHNEVAVDLGDVSGLRTTNKDNLVDAMNSLQDKAFFFQEYIFDGELNQIVFTGADRFDNTLEFRDNRIQVFVRDEHLAETVDYNISGSGDNNTRTTVTLTGDYASGGSKAVQAGDKVIIYSFTGSFEGVAESVATASRFTLSDSNSIFNNNPNGVIINKNNTAPITTLESGFNFQVNGKSFFNDDVNLDTGKTLTAPTVTDGTLSINSGAITGGTTATFSGEIEGGSLDINGNGDISGSLDIAGGYGSSGVSISTGGSIQADGDLNVEGATTLDGAVTLGNEASDNINFTGSLNSDVLPSTNNSKNLGSSTLKFANMHSTTFTGDLAGNATTATTLETARTLGGVSFDGSADINLPGVNTAGNQDTSGNAASATVLETARNIGGVSFDGSASINLPGVNIAGNQNTSGNAATATALATARSIAGNSFDGTANISIDIGDLANVTSSVPTAGQILAYDSDNSEWRLEDQGTTSTITETGTRKFYTETRGDTSIKQVIGHSNHTNISVSEVNNPGDSDYEIRFTAAATYGDSNVTTYLSTRADAGLSVDNSGNLSADVENGLIVGSNANDKIQLDYEVISSGSLSGTPSGTGDAVGHLYFVI